MTLSTNFASLRFQHLAPHPFSSQVECCHRGAPAGDGAGLDEDAQRGAAPLILEDPRAVEAWGGLWLAEVDLEDGGSSKSKWVGECRDVVCVVSSSRSDSLLSPSDERRVQQHLEAGRRLFLVVNRRSASQTVP